MTPRYETGYTRKGYVCVFQTPHYDVWLAGEGLPLADYYRAGVTWSWGDAFGDTLGFIRRRTAEAQLSFPPPKGLDLALTPLTLMGVPE